MRYQSKLLITAGLLFALSLSAAALAYWGIERSLHNLDRSRMADRQLEIYLQLSRRIYHSTLQSVVALAEGDRERAIALAPPSAGSRADVQRAWQLIRGEIAVVGDDEKAQERQELLRLAEIELEIAELGESLRRAGRDSVASGGPASRVAAISNLSDPNAVFTAQIDAAIAGEAAEVSQTDRAARQLYDRLMGAAKLHALLAAFVTAACLLLLFQGLRRPLADLMAGTQALAAGDLSHRIQLSGQGEFASLARSFNSMASELQAQRKQLKRGKAELEKAVAKRTEELRLANEALERADGVRRRFLAEVGHELRTPLTIIRGEAQVSLRSKPGRNCNCRPTLRRVTEQTKHMSVLVDDLLFIARHDANESCLALDTVPLGELAADICADVEVMAAERNISIHLTCEDKELQAVGDADRLRQVILILLNNAICYSRPAGDVYVELSSDREHILVEIRDLGIGIKPEDVDLVFERYWRAGNARQHSAEGMGLGLPVAKAIVEAHGGRIAMESVLNAGTSVSMELPKAHPLEGAA